MTDSKTKNKGIRIAAARVKGAAAAKSGKPRENPYKNPNMSLNWLAGYDEAAAKVPTCGGALDAQGGE